MVGASRRPRRSFRGWATGPAPQDAGADSGANRPRHLCREDAAWARRRGPAPRRAPPPVPGPPGVGGAPPGGPKTSLSPAPAVDLRAIADLAAIGPDWRAIDFID